MKKLYLPKEREIRFSDGNLATSLPIVAAWLIITPCWIPSPIASVLLKFVHDPVTIPSKITSRFTTGISWIFTFSNKIVAQSDYRRLICMLYRPSCILSINLVVAASFHNELIFCPTRMKRTGDKKSPCHYPLELLTYYDICHWWENKIDVTPLIHDWTTNLQKIILVLFQQESVLLTSTCPWFYLIMNEDIFLNLRSLLGPA